VRRFRFGAFVLSPRRRTLLRDGVEQPLIPRYFDLLLFLVERRGEAVHRREIFDRVWSDVIVSDSALSQAIRTIRRALDDDSREVKFVRTVSRHGYEFVFVPVIEEDDTDSAREMPARSDTLAEADSVPVSVPAAFGASASSDADRTLEIDRLLATLADRGDEDQARDAASRLHAYGTDAVLQILGSRPGHARARALLRDTRWDTPTAGPVPILGQPDPLSVGWQIVQLRVRAALGLVATRWAGASLGGASSGVMAGTLGGLALVGAPGSSAPLTVVPVLATLGAFAGAVGGAGVGAGLAVAEATMRSRRAHSSSAERSAAASWGCWCS
jgi:DNA-binding winged helix-turn-helix (wHTH) protein